MKELKASPQGSNGSRGGMVFMSTGVNTQLILFARVV